MNENLRKKRKIYNSEDVYPVFGRSPDPTVSTTWYRFKGQAEAKELAGTSENQDLLEDAEYGFMCIETDRPSQEERVLYTVRPLNKRTDTTRKFLVRFPKNDLLAADLMHVNSQHEIASGEILLKESDSDLTPENMLQDGFYEFDLVRPDRYFGEKITAENSAGLSVVNTVSINNATWYRLSNTPVIRSKIEIMSAVEKTPSENHFAWIRKGGKKYVIATGTETGPTGNTLFSLTPEESKIIDFMRSGAPVGDCIVSQ